MSRKPISSIRATHSYILCGWNTRSDIPLTAVPTMLRGDESADVLIQIAHGNSPISKATGRFAFQHSAEYSLIRINEVADFEIRRGRQIRVWPAAGANQKDIEIFLSGPAWATLCHQRGLLPLHASAIGTAKGIIAFAGHSGAGKSTTAASLNSLGYDLIADDILPVSFNQKSVPGAWPFLRRMKLHGDPITQLGLTPIEVVSTLDKEKYFVSPKSSASDKWSALNRLYLLEIDRMVPRVLIERITGAAAVHAIVDHTYHFHFIRGSGRFREHLAFCAQLASRILIYRLRWSPLSDDKKMIGSHICAHLKGTGA